MLVDLHLDLAMNAVEWNRDLSRPLEEIRAREAHLADKPDKPDRGRGTVCLGELRKAGAALVVATQIARVRHDAFSPVAGWWSPAQAWAMTQAQLAWYRAMEEAGELIQVRDRAGLDRHLDAWEAAAAAGHPRPIGYVLSLEGADSLVTLGHLERAHAYGLRALGPAHYGPGVYAHGTNASGGLTGRGRELLREMDRLGLILDVTHLSDAAFREALDLFDGPVWASHHLCRALVPHQRQLADDMIGALVGRGAVIGMAFDAWMMVPGWVRGESTPSSAALTLARIVEHVDRVCDLAGNARHVAIGSDLDGAFGTEQTPQDLERYSDLARLPGILAARGYAAADVDGILGGNALRFLRDAWRA